MFIKFSILLLYRRLFPSRQFLWRLYGTGAFVLCYTIAAFLCFVLQCVPLESLWNPTVTGRCIDIILVFILLGALNAATDAAILVLPLPELWKLNMTPKRKYQIVGIFLTGGL